MKLPVEIELGNAVWDYYRELFDREAGGEGAQDFEAYMAQMASLLLTSLYESSVVR